MARRGVGLLLAAGLLLGAQRVLPAQQGPSHGSKARSLDSAQTAKLGTLIDAIAEQHIDTVSAAELQRIVRDVTARYADSAASSDELYRKAVDAVVSRLHDPHTRINFADRDESERGTVGIMVHIHGRQVVVSGPPFFRYPAALAGIQPGDELVAVDGKPVEAEPKRVYGALHGPVGSRVSVSLRRPGVHEPITVTLNRTNPPVTNVKETVGQGVLLRDSIGCIATFGVAGIAFLGGHTGELLAEQIDSLRALGMRALILDMRQNPGGAGDVAEAMSDLFLDEGREIGTTNGRGGQYAQHWVDREAQAWPDLPVVILVSNATASSAEVITSALHENDRAMVIGVPTYGKGVGQTSVSIDSTTNLTLVVTRWYTPTGHNIGRATPEGAYSSLAQMLSDSALQQRPRYKTVGGRWIRGGEGIVPDIIVPPAPLSAAENKFYAALGEKVEQFRAALTEAAAALKQSKSVPAENFTVTPTMRTDVYRRLSARGVTISQADFDAAGALVDRELGYEIAGAVFGRAAELRRRLLDDNQVQTAIAMLRKAPTPDALMRLATSDQGYGYAK